MPQLLLLLAGALASGSAPVSDDEAAVIYMQSRVVPATFDLCAQYHPQSAGDYDTAIAAWMLRNSATIERGGAHARAQLQREGQDIEAVLAEEVKRLEATIRGLDANERSGMCERMLQTTRDES